MSCSLLFELCSRLMNNNTTPPAMKTPSTTPTVSFDEIIFEGRNKSYGAYEIRTSYERTVKKSFLIATLLFTGIILFVSNVALRHTPHAVIIPDLSEPVSAYTAEDIKILDESPAAASASASSSASGIYKPVDQVNEHQTQSSLNQGSGETGLNTNEEPGDHTSTAGGRNLEDENKKGKGDARPGGDNTQTEYTVGPEVMPQFPGGEEALRNFIMTSFRIPNAMDESSVRLKVFFIVDENGRISNVEIPSTVLPSLSGEAERVVKSMPQWTPGKVGGRAVKVKYCLPIHIRIR